MSKNYLVILIVLGLVVLLLIVGIQFYKLFTKPLYTPGKLSEIQIPSVEQSKESKYWVMNDNTKINHFFEGEGEDILFIHGYPISPVLEPIEGLKNISKSRTIHYYHWRGCGLSDRPIDKFSGKNFYTNMLELDRKLGIATQLTDIEQIRQILGNKKIIIIGHSYGGFLASLYASEFPDNVDKLILLAPANVTKLPQDVGGLYNDIEEHIKDKQKYKDWLKNNFDYKKLFTKNEKEIAELNLDFIPFYREMSEIKGMPFVEGDWNSDIAGGWVVHAVNLSLGRKYDLRPFLKNIKAKTLIIHGDIDVNGPEESKAYNDFIPNVKFQIIEGAGHFPFNDKPEEFEKIVKDFLIQ